MPNATLTTDPIATLTDRVRAAQTAYEKADTERRRVFAMAHRTGAMTLAQIGELAGGVSDSTVRTLIARDLPDAAERRRAQAAAALDLLDPPPGG